MAGNAKPAVSSSTHCVAALACAAGLWVAGAGTGTVAAVLLQPVADRAAPTEQAERLFRRAADAIRVERERAGWRQADRPGTSGLEPSRAALIGVELSPLVTTMGSLESKRLATDPRWARVLVDQLAARGVGSDTTVTASFSGSFPGLNLAVMAACRALGARVVAVSSVTASTWGANEPGSTWPEMERMVVAAGALPAATVAVSVGGTSDAGRDLGDEGLALARRIQRETAAALHAQRLEAASLAEAVDLRIAAYRAALAGAAPVAYVNVGGNHASLGGASAGWRHDGGWLAAPGEPGATGSGTRSVVACYLARGVPVLSLLDVKALARRWGVG